MLANISNIVNILTVFQLLVLAYVVSSKGKLANKFLLGFLLTNAFLVFISLLFSYNIFNGPAPFTIVFLFYSSFLLLGPFVYLYIKSIGSSEFRLTKFDQIHFIGFLFGLLYLSLDYYIRSSNSSDGTVNSLTQTSYTLFTSFFLIQLLIYIIISFVTLNTFNKRLKIEFSSIENKDLSWLKYLLVIYFFHWFFDAVNFMIYLFKVPSSEPYTILSILAILTLLFFSTWVVIKGLKQSVTSFEIEQKGKYADSSLSKLDSEMYVSELINYMETSQPYLEPSLKINELAQSLSIPSKSLSQSINQHLGKNFYDFVNSYRIEEAKKKIVKANGNGRTILEILYDSGFNSKAAFNRAFKKHTGVTPTEYKRSL